MRAMTVKVPLEIEELHLQISGRPEEAAVQTFAANGANQPFNEGMRERHVRHGHVGDDWPRVAAKVVGGRLTKRRTWTPGLSITLSLDVEERVDGWDIAASEQTANVLTMPRS
jgi:hypothetical protein